MKDSRRAFHNASSRRIYRRQCFRRDLPKDKADDQLAIPAASEPSSTAAPVRPSISAMLRLMGRRPSAFLTIPIRCLIGSGGELRYGHPGTNINIDAFSAVVDFSAFGMEADRVTRQELEAAGVPIVTYLDRQRPEAQLELNYVRFQPE